MRGHHFADAATMRYACGKSRPRVNDHPDRGLHHCVLRDGHARAMCLCACGRDFRDAPVLETATDWLAEGIFMLRVADDRVREADRARWSTRPDHQRTDAQRAALIHDSLGAHANAMACLLHAQRMLTQ